DWFNFAIILGLLFLNAIIGYIEEARAESAVDALRQTLALRSRCWRDADALLLGINASGSMETEGGLLVDQSSLTGESLAVRKKKGDEVYSSTVVKQGQQLAVVTKTGARTFIGTAAHLIATTPDEGHFQKTIGRIGNFLILLTLILVFIIVIVQYIRTGSEVFGENGIKILGQVLILAVAAIPVGLPTVMAVTMAVGARKLASRQVIVKRLAAVEEMSSLNVLCSDKTGTLTKNELTFDEPYLCDGYSSEDLLLYSYLASEFGANDPIELAVRTAAEAQVPMLKNRTLKQTVPGYEIQSFTPFNPNVKRTEATVTKIENKTTFKVAKEDQWQLVGLISLLDPPREDSADTIERCLELGITVKMVTGDQQIIAKEVSRRLGLGQVILDSSHLNNPNIPEAVLSEKFYRADGFAEVTPEHKFKIVDALQRRARSAADIVLLAPGLSAIIDGISASRAIFQRMRSYALYRITSTIHFLCFFFVVQLVYEWALPPKLLIMICILNDLATLVIAVDNAQVSRNPDKWRVGQLIFLSFLLGFLLTALSFGHLFYFMIRDNLYPGRDARIDSIMYLHISSAPHFLIFSTRLSGYFWENMPSPLFTIVIMGTQVIALLMVIFGWFTEATPVPQALAVFGVSLVSFMVLDVVKVQVFRHWTSWSHSLACAPFGARRRVLKRRKQEQIHQDRVWKSIEQVHALGLKTKVLVALKNVDGDFSTSFDAGRGSIESL
ncbi:hypothetical protein BGW38_004642, partial [Lunasporangiospora selenospora]